MVALNFSFHFVDSDGVLSSSLDRVAVLDVKVVEFHLVLLTVLCVESGSLSLFAHIFLITISRYLIFFYLSDLNKNLVINLLL
jgi:hypothetical protein